MSASEDDTPNPSLEELLTVQEVAAELKLDRRTIYRYLKAGELRGLRFKGVWRIRRSDLAAFLEAQRPNITDT
jgi:excisionase family DNA binding protein